MTLRLLKNRVLFLSILIAWGAGINNMNAQKNKSKKQGKEQEKTKKEKTIEELTKSSKKLEGLFTMYRDTITGVTHMLITEDQIDKEYIYFSQVADGVSDIGMYVRGIYLDSKVIKIKKHFDKIEFIAQNSSFYFDANNALSKSAEANISAGVMSSIKIAAQDLKKGTYLIPSDDLFLKETFEQIKYPDHPKSSPFDFKLGKLSSEKTKIDAIKSYPENVNVTSHYVYNNASVLNPGSEALSDGRNVTIKVEHSLIALPKNEYQPRYDDPRIGYFFTQVTDMTSASVTPYKDLIHRWNLIKKEPNLSVSEPKEPIVWWIENTTPLEFRETIKEAVLEWNKAFEQAGFKNAIVVKTQPDDATWDAGDIRYNVLRWTSSPDPQFGGYGPSFVNPKTGQILGADIMLEYVFHTNRVKYNKLFNLHGNEQKKQVNVSQLNYHNPQFCSYSHTLQENMIFGHTALLASGANENEMKGMKREAMKELIMHEVGHTLGLNHNMKASQLFTPKQLNDPEFIKGKCLTGSVMDYSAINLIGTDQTQGPYYSTTVGPYDKWAIQYGYMPTETKEQLEKIANQSTQPELIFGNDADDMRSPGKAIDPRVMTGDMSNDQITYSINRMKLVNTLMPKIKSKFNIKGQSYQELRQAFYILRSQYRRAGDVISRFIGGVYVDRSMIGQDSSRKPYTPVSYADQKRAMQALNQYVFAPNAYDAPSDLYNYIAMQRRGFNFFFATEDPKIHNLVLGHQTQILNHLLHHNTLQRIIDSELYGNTYTLSEFMTDLNNAIFAADSSGSINTYRQNLQSEYVKKLISILEHPEQETFSKIEYPNAAKSMALYNLKKVKTLVSNMSGNTLTKAHKDFLKTLINNTIKDIE
ncbi:zinc-dependent metalloprotease [Aquimarina pacifica]|uniref:zinc-dependent metalloprotease n=1 Tax=Aquimarina pacifica TaxID=1296415 RepID=UPI0004709430|nr:zinc-dependent metalloprotease [Aquimarina pacifica]